MRYEQMLAEMSRVPWAMLPDDLLALCTVVQRAAAGDTKAQEEIDARISNRKAEEIARADGRIAVIPVEGVISHRGWWGASTRQITENLRAAAGDSSIKAIVLDIDSPGGSVSGIEELAREIRGLRDRKPIVAVANATAASAAYWLASQASDVVVTPTGQVGSIGVYMAHVDVSRAMEQAGLKVTFIHAGEHKVEGNPFEPLADEARATAQGHVDAYYRMFTDAVRRGRGDISSDVMQGRMYTAEQAKEHKLADRVATLDETISRYISRLRAQAARAELLELSVL